LPVNWENAAMPPAPPSPPSRVNRENRQTSSRIGIRNWTMIAFVGLPDCWSTVTEAPPAVSSSASCCVCAPDAG
jgi:hypothetical protein